MEDSVRMINASLALLEQQQQRLSRSAALLESYSWKRTLERGFQKHLGQSVSHEITQVRVERAKQMLIGTTLKAHEIALKCGFSDVVHLSKAFHRLTGSRPSIFRRQNANTTPNTVLPEGRDANHGEPPEAPLYPFIVLP